jgi:hypothetical protein
MNYCPLAGVSNVRMAGHRLDPTVWFRGGLHDVEVDQDAKPQRI